MFTFSNNRHIFDDLCRDYYEKILRYLYAALGDETAAKDCTQEVFLVACQKEKLLSRHPNPGGFLFQTAKNMVKKVRRESFARMMKEELLSDNTYAIADPSADIHREFDRLIDADSYIDTVLSGLSEDKLRLYSMHYIEGKTMAEIAAKLGDKEPAVRMRFVRLRREIKELVSRAGECFDTI